MAPLVTISLLGGVLGAVLLLHTPQATFMHLIPYLFGAATLLFAFGKRLTCELSQVVKHSGPLSLRLLMGLGLVQLLIAVYGGFFGGGMGILMLAM